MRTPWSSRPPNNARVRFQRSPERRRMPAELEAFEDLEAAACHRFRNRDLLRRALTHRSRVHDDQAVTDNEQLEFLGDAILGFLTIEALVARYPDWPEGRLSKL